MTTNFTALYQIIGYTFQNPDLLKQALTHTSIHSGFASYERLEFLGDRVLGLLVAEELFDKLPSESEGNLAKRHAQLVKTETLAAIAEDMGLGSHILMARGEANTGGRHKISLLSDVMEAIIAAIYRDGGLESARHFIREHWSNYTLAPLTLEKDPKTALQEISQSRGCGIPVYRTVEESGPAHSPMFTIQVVIEGLGQAIARGSSKRRAEKEAAEILLNQLQESKQ